MKNNNIKNQEVKNFNNVITTQIVTPVFSVVDLWNIQKQVRTAFARRRAY